MRKIFKSKLIRLGNAKRLTKGSGGSGGEILTNYAFPG